MPKHNQYFPQSIPHPGAILAEKLEEMGMDLKEFALHTEIPVTSINAILKGESSITADIAIKFEKVTKIPVTFWMNYQRGYEEFYKIQ